jgi:hypothetical protein
MTHSLFRTLTLAGMLAAGAAAPAAAQVPEFRPSRSLVPAAFPRWDAGGSLGFLGVTGDDARVSWEAWDQKFEYRFDLGYYLTTHLKTEVAVSSSSPTTDYETVSLPIPGIPAAYAYNTIERQLHTVAPAVTWQFRDNTFMHPYVSAGVKIGALEEHRHRPAVTQRFGTVSYPVTALDERNTSILVRPFVAGGFKSYISRSVFARTELRLGFAQDGVRQVSVGAGVGVDF